MFEFLKNYKTLKIKTVDNTVLIPQYSSELASGLDIFAHSEPEIRDNYIVYKTGIFVEIPKGYDLKIYPRSSIRKMDLILANSVGVVDEDYRGEIEISFRLHPHRTKEQVFQSLTEGHLHNLNIYKKGDMIVQMMLEKKVLTKLKIVNELSKTKRGECGHGSTGG